MALWDNPGLAAHLVRDLFLPQVQHLREAVMKRLLVTFDSISEEAEAEGQELWESASKLAHPDADPGSIAGAAEEAAYTKHSLLEGVRQGLLNMSAAWLGHLVEQQSLVLLRRMYLRGELRPPGQDLKLGVLQQRMLAEGLDLSALEGWSAIRELRLVTNVVKHGEGPSAVELRETRPDLFAPEAIRENHPYISAVADFTEVYQPLAGEDLYVLEPDLEAYFDSAERFWMALQQELEDLAGW